MPPLVPLDIVICLAIISLALGLVIGMCIRPSRLPRMPRFDVPYTKGQGEPQPYEWTPSVAEAHRRK